MSGPTPPVVPFAAWCEQRRLGGTVTDWQFVATGWESEIWGLTIGGRRLVLREYHGAGGEAKSHAEHRALVALAACGYPVPEVVAVEHDPRHLGRAFILMERIDGPLLAERPGRGAAELGVLQARLHGLDPARLVELGAEGHSDAASVVGDQVHAWSRVITDLKISGFESAMEFLAGAAATVSDGHPGMAHWDVHPWNVIDDPRRGPRVIDWTSAEITDTRFDLAAALVLWISNRMPQARSEHLDAYRGAGGHRVDHLEFFEAAAALRRLFATVVGLRRGPELLGMRSDARQEILDHVPGLVAVYRRWREVGGPAIPDAESALGV